MRLRPITIIAALAVFPASLPAGATGYRATHHHRVGYPRVAYGAGFADPLIQGDYVGEPFLSVPRPNHLVPTPWSYGTYGVPTVSGIAAAPTGQPTLTVIHSQGVRKGRAASQSADETLSDMRVLNVSVPRR